VFRADISSVLRVILAVGGQFMPCKNEMWLLVPNFVKLWEWIFFFTRVPIDLMLSTASGCLKRRWAKI
jgi:hypothetical protein